MIGPTSVRRFCSLAQPALKLSSEFPVEEAPIFVIGSGRSGNTLLRRLLLASGQIYIPPETYVLGDIIEGWYRSVRLPWRQRVWLFCAFFERHKHFGTFGLPNLNEFALQAEGLKDRRLATLIDAFFRFLAVKAGSKAKRWGDKTPWNTNHLPSIGWVFPQARFVWLIRDGRDVALSYIKAGLYDDLESAATRWETANRQCRRFSRWAPHVYKIRYEDLVSNPDRECASLFAWAGLDYGSEVLDKNPGHMGDVEALSHHSSVSGQISTGSVGKWREDTASIELFNASSRFQRENSSLGYV